MAMTASPMFNPGLLLALPAGQGTSTPGASSSKLRIARNPTTRIRQAVRDNNVTLLQRLAHQDLRNTDRNRLTSLSWAAVDGSLEVFEWLLLDYGHDDQELSRDSDNNTLLHLLASIPISPSPSSVPYSVPSTPAFPPLPPLAPHVRSRISQSMLGLYHAIFPFLLDWSNSGGKTALHVASQAGNADLVSLLLERGADAELTDLQGNTPLHYAAAWGHEEAAEVLMREGEAMWSTRNAEGFTPGDYAWNQAARQRLGVVWEDEVKRRKAQREEEEREREREEREEREYQQEMRRMYDHQAMDQEKGFDLSPTDTRGSAGEAHDTHRRRPSRQFDPSSLPYQARSSAPSHAHWQSRVPLPARADSLQSVQPSPQSRAGPQYSVEDRDRQSEWLDSPDLSPSPIPQRPGLVQRDSHSSGPSFSGYATPRWDVSPGPGSAPGVAVGRAEENPISAHVARMAPPSAPSRNRPTMHHRRSSSMAQALGPGVTLAPPLPHIAIEHQASGQAPLPSLRYAEEEEDEGDEAVLNDTEDLESPLSYLGVPGQSQKGLSHEAAQQQQQIEAGMGRMSVQGAGLGQGRGQGQGHGQGDWPGQQAMASSGAKLGSTPARGTAAGPPVW